MHLKQIILLGGVTLVMGGLLSLDIHKAGIPAPQNVRNSRSGTGSGTGSAAAGSSAAINTQKNASTESPAGMSLFEEALIHSATAKLKPYQKAVYAQLSKSALISPENSHKLGEFWLKASNPGLAGISELRSDQNFKGNPKTSAADLLSAANHFRAAIARVQASAAPSPAVDSVEQTREIGFYASRAIETYKKILIVDPKNLNAQTGLGVCYVTASENPMQGIALLLGVVKQDPENLEANFNLGLFSMRSGQFDKAIERFKTVVRKQNNGEAWFYLAQAYSEKGDKAQAIEAYQTSKKYISDQATRQSIDQLIQQAIN